MGHQKIIKNIFLLLPVKIKRQLISGVEYFFRKKIDSLIIKSEISAINQQTEHTKKRILFFHRDGLAFGGSERSLQIAASIASKEYDVFFMHSSDLSKPTRKAFVERFATLIPFTKGIEEKVYPYYINSMHPSVEEVIAEYGIDAMVVSCAGRSEFPFLNITKIPILVLNNFGGPTVQENIKKIIFVSETVKKHAESYVGESTKHIVLPIPMMSKKRKGDVPSLRETLSIPQDAFIFGRMGRNSDSIFDPIGIRAFKETLSINQGAHYVILGPSPKLKRIVEENSISNVHYLDPTSDENIIWAFHFGIDALAHFRYDGETQGLNIGESMYAGKPIITHISHKWNAHLDYLTPAFSRVAQRDNHHEYAKYMLEFMTIKSNDPLSWKQMQESAKQQADSLFNYEKYEEKMIKIFHDIL